MNNIKQTENSTSYPNYHYKDIEKDKKDVKENQLDHGIKETEIKTDSLRDKIPIINKENKTILSNNQFQDIKNDEIESSPKQKENEFASNSIKNKILFEENKNLQESTQTDQQEKVKDFLNQAKHDITKFSSEELEQKFREALKLGKELTIPEEKTTLLEISERVAQSYIKNGNFEEAIKIRIKTAEAISPAPPLSDLHLKLQNDVNSSGLRLQPIDTSTFKNHTLIVQKRNYGETAHLHIETKIQHHAREQLQGSLSYIEQNPDKLFDALPQNFCTKVKVTNADSITYEGRITKNEKKWTGDFSSDVQKHGFEIRGPESKQKEEDEWEDEWGDEGDKKKGLTEPVCKIIEFEGVGRIKIGCNKDIISEYNRLTIDLDPSISEDKVADTLKIMLGAIGFGTISSSSRQEDTERIKLMQLFRAYYPSEAYSFERDQTTFEGSIESLKKRIEEKVPGMKEKIKDYLVEHPEKMYQQEVYPGQYIWAIDGLAKEVKAAGGMGLMAGIFGQNFGDATHRFISMLKTGPMSTQDRLQAGIIAVGESSEADLKSGGAESVFMRLLDNDMPKNLKNYPLSGKFQVLYDLKLLERVGYAYSQDTYGSKEPKYYQGRQNVIDFTKNLEGHKIDNEVCIRNRVPPTFIKGVRVNNQEEKQELIKALRLEGLIVKDNFNNEYIVSPAESWKFK